MGGTGLPDQWLRPRRLETGVRSLCQQYQQCATGERRGLLAGAPAPASGGPQRGGVGSTVTRRRLVDQLPVVKYGSQDVKTKMAIERCYKRVAA